MRTLVTIFFSLMCFVVNAQENTRFIGKGWIVRTNVYSLIAKRPTFSIEKSLGKTISAEVCFVQGEFNHVLFTDHYAYQGFLIRAKKYLGNPGEEGLRPYAGVYTGNLHRTILTTGKALDANVGLFGYPSRKFSGQSIRGGGTLGLSYFAMNRINIDWQASLGYGRYLNLDLADPNTYSKGYPDLQLWASIGYCF